MKPDDDRYEKTVLILPKGTIDVWRNIAAELGFCSIRGPLQGEGSPSQMIRAMLDGKLDIEELGRVVARVRLVPPEQRSFDDLKVITAVDSAQE